MQIFKECPQCKEYFLVYQNVRKQRKYGIVLCGKHHDSIANKEKDYESLFQSIVAAKNELCEA